MLSPPQPSSLQPPNTCVLLSTGVHLVSPLPEPSRGLPSLRLTASEHASRDLQGGLTCGSFLYTFILERT